MNNLRYNKIAPEEAVRVWYAKIIREVDLRLPVNLIDPT